jgi:hypothetical protein
LCGVLVCRAVSTLQACCVSLSAMHTNSGVHALAQLVVARKSRVNLRGMWPGRRHDGRIYDGGRHRGRLRHSDLAVHGREGHGGLVVRFGVAGEDAARRVATSISLAPLGPSDIIHLSLHTHTCKQTQTLSWSATEQTATPHHETDCH